MDSYEVTFQYTSGTSGKQIVQATNVFDARKYVEGLPGIKRVNMVLRVQEKKFDYNSNKRSNSSSDESGSTGGGVLLILIIGLVTFVNTLPWSAMVAGGMVGTWISQILTGTGLQEAFDENKNKTATFILIAALSLGGFGFVKGSEFKKEYDSPVTPSTPQLNVNK